MNLEKQKAFIIRVAYFTLILSLVYVGIKYLLPLLMPFVIGMIIAVLFRRLIDLIEAKTHIKRAFVSIFILLVFYGILGYLIFLIGFKIVNFVGDLVTGLPSLYRNTIVPALQSIANDIIHHFPGAKAYLDDFMNNLDTSIFNYLSNASSTIAPKITGLAGMVPSMLIKLIFTIVSSFFFTIDYYKVSTFIIVQFKGARREMLLKIKHNGIGTLGKFIRAYAAIISITFTELSIGFWIIGITNPLLLALLVAIVDILPILGTGAVILPWSIISFATGDMRTGIGMLILYIVITAVRQTIEPRIVGQQIGLHPIITLILMFVGAQLMGVLGLLLLPIMATLIKKLNDEGTIHLFRYK